MPAKKEEIIRSGAKLGVEEESFFKRHEFFLSLVSFILFIVLLVFFSKVSVITAKPVCGDESLYETCSSVKPYYCGDGVLIEKASLCGCVDGMIKDGDSCKTNLQKEPEDITLNYILNGEEKEFSFAVYGGLANYLSQLSRIISYSNGGNPDRADFKLKDINDEEQRKLLLPLVIQIQNLTNNKVDQARIAISLAQNIEYGFSNKTAIFFGQEINYSRYPYEVLYDSQGVCGEKSELLSFLLRELGYGVVIFYNQPENHESVGIKCPEKESYRETGYCFVETTGPSILTDDSIEFVGGITLKSEPEVILISDGISLPENLKEYQDAETIKNIRTGKIVLFQNSRLENLKEKYGLVEEYNII